MSRADLAAYTTLRVGGPAAEMVAVDSEADLVDAIASADAAATPVLVLGLLKNVGIRQSAQIPPDIRAYSQALLTSLPSQLLIPYTYPTFYSLHNMPPEVFFTVLWHFTAVH